MPPGLLDFADELDAGLLDLKRQLGEVWAEGEGPEVLVDNLRLIVHAMKVAIERERKTGDFPRQKRPTPPERT